jgi:plasmid stability protein
MATLTIKNVPEPLVRRLKKQALLHRRSMNLEVITCLEGATHAVAVDADALLARARSARRAPADLRLTDAMLARLKTAGRP